MGQASRRRALEAAGLLHPRPGDVVAPLFATVGFFLSVDKVQVKYEMLRAHVMDGVSVTQAARTHGYSRAAFYLAAADFAESGMTGLLDERRGRHGPVKLSPQIIEYLQQAPTTLSGADLAGQVAEQFDVRLHRRTIDRARRR